MKPAPSHRELFRPVAARANLRMLKSKDPDTNHSAAATPPLPQPPVKANKKHGMNPHACQRCQIKKLKCTLQDVDKTKACVKCEVAEVPCVLSPSSKREKEKEELQMKNETLQCQLEVAESRVQELQELLTRIRRSATLNEVHREIQSHDCNSTPEELETPLGSLKISIPQAGTEARSDLSGSDSIMSPDSLYSDTMFSHSSENTSLSEACTSTFQMNEAMTLDHPESSTTLSQEPYIQGDISLNPYSTGPEGMAYDSSTVVTAPTAGYCSTLSGPSGLDSLADPAMFNSRYVPGLLSMHELFYNGASEGLNVGGNAAFGSPSDDAIRISGHSRDVHWQSYSM